MTLSVLKFKYGLPDCVSSSKSVYKVLSLAHWFLTGSREQWDDCFGPNKTAYVYPDQMTAEVKLDDDDAANLPAGEYEFKRSFGSDVCPYYVVILSKC